MKYCLLLVCSFCCSLSLSAQDIYHQELIDFLKNDYDLEGASFVFDNTEDQNISSFFIYGNSTLQTDDINNFTFTKKSLINVNSVGSNGWDSGCGISNKQSISQNDVVLFTFWARKISEESSLSLFIEDNTTFEKEVFAPISFKQDWSQYFIAFESTKNYSINSLNFGFHLASAIQSFEIAGFTALNFEQEYPLTDIPNFYDPSNYGGSEEDAAWRTEAEARINDIRKSSLTVKLIDLNGNPIEGANVEVNMTKHAFGFGSAMVICRFENNDCYDATYLDKIRNLDGNGHGFNVAVTENALKWDGWEEQWIGSPDETISAISTLDEWGIEVRGHTLIWPGWDNLPSDMEQNSSNLNYLRNRMLDRIEYMVTEEVLGDIITEWDVLNEITTNRDIENAFEGSTGYLTGREIYTELFEKIQQHKPNHSNYINDYVTLSNGGFGETTTNTYKQFISEIVDSDVKLDGIGFQAHIGPFPTSILKVKETLDEFDALYDVDMKITEFDMDDNIDPQVQAKYMTDFMTMIFSHPKMQAFIMWGFYDGNHWKANAPMFDINWNLKPSGEAFNELVFNQWWTNEEGTSGSNGEFNTEVFKGEHEIIVKYNDQNITVNTIINEDDEVEIILDPTAIEESYILPLNFFPNPSNGEINIISEIEITAASLVVRDARGKIIKVIHELKSKKVMLDLPAGMYFLEIINGNQSFVSKWIKL